MVGEELWRAAAAGDEASILVAHDLARELGLSLVEILSSDAESFELNIGYGYGDGDGYGDGYGYGYGDGDGYGYGYGDGYGDGSGYGDGDGSGDGYGDGDGSGDGDGEGERLSIAQHECDDACILQPTVEQRSLRLEMERR